MTTFKSWLVLICILSVVVLKTETLREYWGWNYEALVFNNGKGELNTIKVSDCTHIWLVDAVTERLGDLTAQQRVRKLALSCSPVNISILQELIPLDIDMAQHATRLYPEQAVAWFWLGEALAPIDHLGARQAYLHTVILDPNDGLAWCRLGRNYEKKGEWEMAFDAWSKCCKYGDPGSNGCFGAGRMMEKMGYSRQAIEFYRLSRWEESLKHADELEAQLNSQK